MRNWGPFLLTLVIAIILAVLASTPPTSRSIDSPLNEFSSARAMVDVRIIANAPPIRPAPPSTPKFAPISKRA